ncbi:MAG: N-acetylmuramoyl-L-alanine amidase [Candidatus Eremiobacteraeota bacterium]|nr:N-acetylmuramoyl-L-alanine amidase [Candidatus Eremiobacteraeota bacterium]
MKRTGRKLFFFLSIITGIILLLCISSNAHANDGDGANPPSVSQHDNRKNDDGSIQHEIDRQDINKVTPSGNESKDTEENESDSTPWELTKKKQNADGEQSGGKLPPIEPVKKKESPALKSPGDEVKIEKTEGILKGYSIQFSDEIFSFKDNPPAYLDGKIFICAGDPDFKKLMDKMGLTYSWLSYSGKLFIYSRRGSINWKTDTKKATVGEREINLPSASHQNFGKDYIPMDSLANLLNLHIYEVGNKFEIRPEISISSEFSSKKKTLNLIMHAVSEIKYKARYQANPPAIRFIIPRTSYRRPTDKFFVEGVQVRINGKVDPDNLYVTMEFPPHWKGEIIKDSYTNEILVKMKTNVVYPYGAKDETLKEVEITQVGDQVYTLFKTTSVVQYHWSYDRDEGVLYVDLPLCKPSSSLDVKGFKSKLIRKMDVTVLQPEGLNITRIRLDLKPGASFMIGPPEDQKNYSFALLIGPHSKIPDPSPEMGGSAILMLAGDGNRVIVIDPGHGGSDPGACSHGMKEKDLTLDIAKKLARELTRLGWKVYLTRHTDTDVTYPGSPDRDELQARVDVANKHNAAVFISIHCNASLNSSVRGSSYHWYKREDCKFAKALEGSLGPSIGTIDKGARKDQFYVLNHSKVPAVLIEAAFMTNSHDAKILANPGRRKKIATRLARSISRYVNYLNLARKERPMERAEE